MKKIIILLLAATFILCSCERSEFNNKNIDNNSNHIGNIFVGGLVSCFQNELYYMESHSGETNLYKSDLELKSKEKVSDNFCQYINIYEDKIYYVDLDGFAYVMNKDGTGNVQLTDFMIDYMYLYNNKIYSLVSNNNTDEMWSNHKYNLVYMNLDGSDIKVLCQEEVRRFFVYKEKLYYLYYDAGYNASDGDTGYFRKMNLDGMEDELVFQTDKYILSFSIYDDYMYYICDMGNLEKRHIQDNDIAKIVKWGSIYPNEFFINLSSNLAIYQERLGGFYLTDLISGKDMCIVDSKRDINLYNDTLELLYETSFYVAEDNIYFYNNGMLEYVEFKTEG